MNNVEEVRNRVHRLLSESSQITITSGSYEDKLHLDSIALLELIVAIEKEFGIKVDESSLDPMEHFRNVTSIAQFVSQHFTA